MATVSACDERKLKLRDRTLILNSEEIISERQRLILSKGLHIFVDTFPHTETANIKLKHCSVCHLKRQYIFRCLIITIFCLKSAKRCRMKNERTVPAPHCYSNNKLPALYLDDYIIIIYVNTCMLL